MTLLCYWHFYLKVSLYGACWCSYLNNLFFPELLGKCKEVAVFQVHCLHCSFFWCWEEVFNSLATVLRFVSSGIFCSQGPSIPSLPLRVLSQLGLWLWQVSRVFHQLLGMCAPLVLSSLLKAPMGPHDLPHTQPWPGTQHPLSVSPMGLRPWGGNVSLTSVFPGSWPALTFFLLA